MGVSERYHAAAAELAAACRAAGRDPEDVRLVAVSKTVGLEEVRLAADAGAGDFGENRPDQLMQKADAFPQLKWHFIGNIQSRRIRDVVGRATLIHSLCDLRHAERMHDVAAERGIVQDVLLEVNVSGEQSKAGFAPEAVAPALDACLSLAHIRVCGLMTMAPIADEDVVRAVFGELRRLRDGLRADLPDEAAEAFCELSMGMSDDWRLAVQEGATIVRIGRAVFSDGYGPRSLA